MLNLDNILYSQKPSNKNLEQYPTILDYIDAFMAKAEQECVNDHVLKQWVTNKTTKRGRYLACRKDDSKNEVALMPTGRMGMNFFRGENTYHEPCFSSIDRRGESSQSEFNKKRLLSHLQTAELKLLLEAHPVVKELLRQKYYFPYEGIAQHYGISTSCIDLTNEIWTAAFFSVTQYHSEDDTYSIYCQDGYGILYYYPLKEPDRKLSIIGMNYFNRPGKQNGYAYKMARGEDLNQNSAFKKLFFRHDKHADERVYNYNAGGQKLFPKDGLFDLVGEIKNQKGVSERALRECNNIYYNNMPEDEFRSLCKSSDISIFSESRVNFSQEEIKRDVEEWNNEGRVRFTLSIDVIPFFRV